MKKKKNERYRLRRKNDGDRAWLPMGWATNSIKMARITAEKYMDDPTVQIYDYVEKKLYKIRSIDFKNALFMKTL